MYEYGDKLRSLEISLTMGCVLNCDFCPQLLLLERYYQNDKKRKKYLEFEDFKKALKQVDIGGTISICGMSEPFSNPKCADMILYAYEQGYSICLNTTLIGATREDLEKIKNVKFENFILHIPDANNHSKFKIDDAYIELLDYVHATQNIDYYSCHGSVHCDVIKHINTEKYAGIALGDRAGNLDLEGMRHYQRVGELICLHGSEKSVGIWAPVMLPDGTIVLCCMDYGMKHILGNLLENTWQEIKNRQPFKEYQEGLKDERVQILCRTCESAKNVNALPSIRLKNIRANGGKTILGKKLEQRFKDSDKICVYGLGKYFKDHYFEEYWNEGIQADFFCDKNQVLWNKSINGIKCISPIELAEMRKILVVIFSLKADEIEESLKTLGITNVVSIDSILNIMKVEEKECLT